MENPTLTITFNLETLELEINAPELPSDFAISLLDRAKKLIENQEKIVMAQAIRAAAGNESRTNEVLKRVKLH